MSMKQLSKGFTLLEAVIVIALVALFAMMALPKFSTIIAKARRAEAYMHLKALWAAQMEYHALHGMYADALGSGPQGLGWKAQGDPVYTYGFPGQSGIHYFLGSAKAPGTALQGAQVFKDGFVLAAAADIDNDGVYDLLTIDQTGKITLVTDDAA